MNISLNSVRTIRQIFATIAVLAMVFSPFANVQFAQADHEGYLISVSSGPTVVGNIVSVSGNSSAHYQTGNFNTQQMSVDWGDGTGWQTTAGGGGSNGGLTFTMTSSGGTGNERWFEGAWSASKTYAAPGSYNVKISVHHGQPVGQDGDDEATFAFQVVIEDEEDEADVEITKTVNVSAPLPGSQIVYTLTATNNGPDTATNVVVTDSLPVGVTYVSANPSPDSTDPLTWSFPSIADGVSEIIEVTVEVDAETEGDVIENTASVSVTEVDNEPDNDSSSVEISVAVPTCDLEYANNYGEEGECDLTCPQGQTGTLPNCVDIETSATINVEKQVTQGSSTTVPFSIRLDNVAQFDLFAGETDTIMVTAADGPFEVSELLPSGWSQVSAVCTYENQSTSSPTSITLAVGGEVSCVFVNHDANIYGCTNDAYDNYNPEATQDDGSCQNDDVVNYCNPAERPAGMSIGAWLAANQVDGSDCFDIKVTEQCGSFNVQFTKNLTGLDYEFRYVIGSTTPALVDWAGEGALPAVFTEDEYGGSVDITYYVVGAEADYFTGFGMPNIWDGNGTTVAVDTDCAGGEPDFCSVVVVSNEEDTVVEKGGAFAEILSVVNGGWDTIADAFWIWGDDPVVDATIDETQTFEKTFVWNASEASITSADLEIAADNGFRIVLNGTEVSNQLGDEFNYASSETFDVASLIVEGENTLSIEVVNMGLEGSNSAANPAGLIYKLVIEGDEEGCDDPLENLYRIFGTVWHDENENDERDTDGEEFTEDTLEGWLITITDGEGFTATTTSDEFGNYDFMVPAGEYVVTQTTEDGWSQTYPNDGFWEVCVPIACADEASLVESIFNTFMPTAHAAVASSNGPLDFGNVRTAPGYSQGSYGGGGNGTRIELRDGGSDDENEDEEGPEPQVLGEATSTLPVGAPNTGKGGAAPVASFGFTFASAILASRKTVVNGK